MTVAVNRSVNPPDEMLDEWVVAPSEQTENRYTAYFHSHKLEDKSEGWTSWIARQALRNTISLIQTTSAFIFAGFQGVAMTTITKNEIAYHAAGRIIQKGHQYYVSKTRVPVDHSRVDAAVAKIERIKKCQNSQSLIDRIQAVYNKGYFSSHGSYQLITVLNSNCELAVKYDTICGYLTKHATLEGFGDLYYHNGKWLYQIIICLVEGSVIK